MNFAAALTAAQAGKTISRPERPGVSFAWITGATTASGALASVKPHFAMVTVQGTLIAFRFEDADYAATDWVAA